MLSGPHPDPLIGSLLDGRYQIGKLLGRGGMGNVYLAEETRLRRRCAIKVLHPQLAEDRTHVERFLREAQTIAQLEHPNIVDIYAYGEEPDGVAWFAMELLIGEDLDARAKARAERPFTTHECCAWGIQIVQAMQVVHDAGLIHRDLKTSNIFLARRRDGEEMVKLLDFGIVRPEGSELTATGVALGTPSYMSPEQVRNTLVDRRSDIYSFGVLLFKLVTGRMPFSGDPIQVALAHCTSPAPVPSVVAPDANISPELDALVLRAMAKSPSERHQSMRELGEALTLILHDEAPSRAPALKPARPPAASQLGPPPDPRGQTTALDAAPPPLISTLDPATAPNAAHPTGPTTALPAQTRARSDRWLYITTGVSLLGVVLVLAVTMLGGENGPAVVPAPTAGKTPISAGVSPTAVEPPRTIPVSEPGSSVPPVAAPSAVEPPTAPEPRPATAPGGPATPAAPPGSAPVPPDSGAAAKAPSLAKPKPKPPESPMDPLQSIERKAQACRRKHRSPEGPKIVIDYAIGIDGRVTRSIPSTADELGECIAAVVAATRFEPKLVLGRKIAL